MYMVNCSHDITHLVLMLVAVADDQWCGCVLVDMQSYDTWSYDLKINKDEHFVA